MRSDARIFNLSALRRWTSTAVTEVSSRCISSRPRTAAPPENFRLSNGGIASSNLITSTRPVRVWNNIPHWCSLCLEPLNDWDNHRGKRDHICLEMFYDILVHTERRWDPRRVWQEVEANVLGLKQDETLLNPSVDPSPTNFSVLQQRSPFHSLFHSFDAAEPTQRRRELNSCLTFLQQKGIVHIDSSNLQQSSFYGGVVMFKELFTPLAQMFPRADAKEVSALTQMVYATYNNETVFDFCQLETLIPEALLRERAAVLPPPSESGEFGDAGMDDAALAADCTSDEAGAVPYYLKGIFFRALLGSLRWALEPDTISPPPGLGIDEDRHAVMCVLAAHAARLLLAELIFCKVSEYVVRVEGVFRREEGLKEADACRLGQGKESLLSEHHGLVPLNSSWGMCQYCGGEKRILNVCGENTFRRTGKAPRSKRAG